MVSGQETELLAALAGLIQLPFELHAYSFLQVPQIPSSLSTLLSCLKSRPYLTCVSCYLRSSAYMLSSEAVITSQQCSDISNLVGVVWVGYGIPMTTNFTHQVILFWRESVTSYLLIPNRYGRKLSLNATSSYANKGHVCVCRGGGGGFSFYMTLYT